MDIEPNRFVPKPPTGLEAADAVQEIDHGLDIIDGTIVNLRETLAMVTGGDDPDAEELSRGHFFQLAWFTAAQAHWCETHTRMTVQWFDEVCGGGWVQHERDLVYGPESHHDAPELLEHRIEHMESLQELLLAMRAAARERALDDLGSGASVNENDLAQALAQWSASAPESQD